VVLLVPSGTCSVQKAGGNMRMPCCATIHLSVCSCWQIRIGCHSSCMFLAGQAPCSNPHFFVGSRPISRACKLGCLQTQARVLTTPAWAVLMLQVVPPSSSTRSWSRSLRGPLCMVAGCGSHACSGGLPRFMQGTTNSKAQVGPRQGLASVTQYSRFCGQRLPTGAGLWQGCRRHQLHTCN
jgi:hypothetical protein